MTTLAELLKEQAALEAKATPGPWAANVSKNGANVGSHAIDKTIFIPTTAGNAIDDSLFISFTRNSAAQIRTGVQDLADALDKLCAGAERQGGGFDALDELDRARAVLNDLGFSETNLGFVSNSDFSGGKNEYE